MWHMLFSMQMCTRAVMKCDEGLLLFEELLQPMPLASAEVTPAIVDVSPAVARRWLPQCKGFRVPEG